MDEGTARSVATAVIRPCGILGHLVGRGAWWPSEEYLKRGKRAVGKVMGSAYYFLVPVWQLHPSLDPGRVPDALGLAEQSTSLQDTPSDLLSLLADVETAVRRAVPLLEEQVPGTRDYLRSAVAEVDASILEVRQVLSGMERV